MRLCEHNNDADECDEICYYCKHECSYHHWSSNVVCFYDNCNCKGFDYNNEFELKEYKG